MGAEGHNLILRNNVLAVGEREEDQLADLRGIALLANGHGHLADSGDGGLLNRLDLPRQVGIIAPGGLQKGVDLRSSWLVGGEVGWIGRCKGQGSGRSCTLAGSGG